MFWFKEDDNVWFHARQNIKIWGFTGYFRQYFIDSSFVVTSPAFNLSATVNINNRHNIPDHTNHHVWHLSSVPHCQQLPCSAIQWFLTSRHTVTASHSGSTASDCSVLCSQHMANLSRNWDVTSHIMRVIRYELINTQWQKPCISRTSKDYKQVRNTRFYLNTSQFHSTGFWNYLCIFSPSQSIKYS